MEKTEKQKKEKIPISVARLFAFIFVCVVLSVVVHELIHVFFTFKFNEKIDEMCFFGYSKGSHFLRDAAGWVITDKAHAIVFQEITATVISTALMLLLFHLLFVSDQKYLEKMKKIIEEKVREELQNQNQQIN